MSPSCGISLHRHAERLLPSAACPSSASPARRTPSITIAPRAPAPAGKADSRRDAACRADRLCRFCAAGRNASGNCASGPRNRLARKRGERRQGLGEWGLGDWWLGDWRFGDRGEAQGPRAQALSFTRRETPVPWEKMQTAGRPRRILGRSCAARGRPARRF